LTHVVTERCVNCRYTDCATICPVSCFYEVKDPAMLVIDPDACIDCMLCVAKCPVHAIYPLDELPAAYDVWKQKNRDLYQTGTNLQTGGMGPLPGALTLEQVQAREKERGLVVPEPKSFWMDVDGKS
jgi:ferredoxin